LVHNNKRPLGEGEGRGSSLEDFCLSAKTRGRFFGTRKGGEKKVQGKIETESRS